MRILLGVAAALPTLFLSYVLLNVWAKPLAWEGWVPFAVGLMVIEFLVVHSGAFVGMLAAKTLSWRARIGAFGALAVFYGLMALGVAWGVDSLSLVVMLLAIMTGRFVAAVRGDPFMGQRISAGVFLYITVVFASVFLPVPEWGITDTVLNDVYPDRGEGIWQQEPERAIAAGALYFLLIGLLELNWGMRSGAQAA